MNADTDKLAGEIAEEICGHTFSDPALPTWKAIIERHIAPLVRERDQWQAKYRQELQDWAVGIVDLVATLLVRVKHFKGTLETTLKGSFDGMQALAKDNAELRAQLEKAKAELAGVKAEVKKLNCDTVPHCGKCLACQLTAAQYLLEQSAKDSTERKGEGNNE